MICAAKEKLRMKRKYMVNSENNKEDRSQVSKALQTTLKVFNKSKAQLEATGKF